MTIELSTIARVATNYDDQRAGGSEIVDEMTVDDPSTLETYGKSHIGLNVSGHFIFIGSPNVIIQFTSDAVVPSHTDWDGLWFWEGSVGELEYVSVSYCTVKHMFWGALHTFQCSPVFEYNMMEDIGHKAIDAHKASPAVRHNHISRARTGMVINFHAGTPVVFEDNTFRDYGAMMQLQENAWARIQGNTFRGSENTGEPWTYGDFHSDFGVTVLRGRPGR